MPWGQPQTREAVAGVFLVGFSPPGGTLWFTTESTCPLVCVSVRSFPICSLGRCAQSQPCALCCSSGTVVSDTGLCPWVSSRGPQQRQACSTSLHSSHAHPSMSELPLACTKSAEDSTIPGRVLAFSLTHCCAQKCGWPVMAWSQ